MALVEVMLAARHLAGNDARAQAVRFLAHAPLGAVDALKSVFSCDLTFVAPVNELELPLASRMRRSRFGAIYFSMPSSTTPGRSGRSSRARVDRRTGARRRV